MQIQLSVDPAVENPRHVCEYIRCCRERRLPHHILRTDKAAGFRFVLLDFSDLQSFPDDRIADRLERFFF